ncbi:hypothetical protein BpHYR1_007168 [Brachionus plicatilis]|uniref:Uncharacterized protein n=1 Tax=Brachionus plicatilis TaxID=10195 RepID=A0A3M7S6L2_BRAPC|nr:hypothetical protein BpHYR1_007168 [Brachionus plicatilis]
MWGISGLFSFVMNSVRKKNLQPQTRNDEHFKRERKAIVTPQKRKENLLFYLFNSATLLNCDFNPELQHFFISSTIQSIFSFLYYERRLKFKINLFPKYFTLNFSLLLISHIKRDIEEMSGKNTFIYIITYSLKST